ncbi:MAG: translation initiation factor IF-2 [Acholeplasmataceae bacterium]|nr:translation initiation factor IF-2 [Acholeplasmataceae bacterium]
MKVKEIIEILNVEKDKLIAQLDNVGIEADLDTEIPNDVIKKLSKLYKKDIKPIKAKTSIEQETQTTRTIKSENQSEGKNKAENRKENVIDNKDKQKKVDTKPKSNAKPAKEEKKEVKPQEQTNIKNKPVVEEELELSRVYDDKYIDFEDDKPQHTRIKNVKKNKAKSTNNRKANVPQEKQIGEKILYYRDGMTVASIADGLKMSIGEVVKKLVMLGYMVSASETVEKDVAELIAEDAGYVLKDEIITDITKFEEMNFEDNPEDLVERPAIVTIMGHVDHGKTTLLDKIRDSHVASGEAGGITQHIGAYQVEKDGKKITFIDTPGHAAFTEMRARGANITDIVVLVVAADDGVMPQTIEAIEHAKVANVPIIVAINKMDKPSANPERVKEELAKYDLLAEEWGGKTIFVPISAKSGQGVEELLEMIILVSEMNEYKANPNRLGIGTVLEAKLDKGRGPVATLLVKNGSIKIGDPVVVGNTWGKIRAMEDESKAKLKVAGPSKAVEITGLVDVPNAGDRFMVFEDEKTARLVAEERMVRTFNKEQNSSSPVSLASLFNNMDDTSKELNLIIKADVQGSIEALKGSIEKVSVEGVKISIVRAAVGAVTETDISLAVASNSIIVAFNIRPNQKIIDLAKEKNIEVRQYNIIYKLLEDIEAAMKGMLDPVYEEKITGSVEIRQLFKVSKIGTIGGSYVLNGYIERNCGVRIIRDSIIIYTGKLSSLRRGKDDVKEVKAGFECGLTIENYNDIKVGDIVEAYVMEEVK